jgi:hypothetical protein
MSMPPRSKLLEGPPLLFAPLALSALVVIVMVSSRGPGTSSASRSELSRIALGAD